MARFATLHLAHSRDAFGTTRSTHARDTNARRTRSNARASTVHVSRSRIDARDVIAMTPRSTQARDTRARVSTRGSEIHATTEAFAFASATSDGSSVTTSRIDARDVRRCAEILYESFAETNERKPRGVVLKYIIEELEREDGAACALACKDDVTGEVLGFVAVSLREDSREKETNASMAPPRGAAVLANACVSVEARRRGVGTALVRAAEALALEVGGCEVWLHVRVDDDRARALYEKCGYEEVARERARWNLGIFAGGKVASPRALMRRTLKPGANFIFD